MKFSLVLPSLSLLLTAASAAGVQRPVEDPMVGLPSSQGCFSSIGSLTDIEDQQSYKSSDISFGFCGDTCRKKGFAVAATRGEHCYCGETYPPEDSVVEDSKCDFTCPGYGKETCGSVKGKFWSVINSGKKLDVDFDESEPSTATDADEANQTSSPTSDSSSETSTAAPEKSGPSGGAIAGIVIGAIIGVAILIGIVYMVYKTRFRDNTAESINSGFPAYGAGSSGAGVGKEIDDWVDYGQVNRGPLHIVNN